MSRQKKESSDETGDKFYIVESVINKRRNEGKVEYLLKWLNYPVEEATWEPEENVAARELVAEFEKNALEKKRRLKNKGPARASASGSGAPVAERQSNSNGSVDEPMEEGDPEENGGEMAVGHENGNKGGRESVDDDKDESYENKEVLNIIGLTRVLGELNFLVLFTDNTAILLPTKECNQRWKPYVDEYLAFMKRRCKRYKENVARGEIVEDGENGADDDDERAAWGEGEEEFPRAPPPGALREAARLRRLASANRYGGDDDDDGDVVDDYGDDDFEDTCTIRGGNDDNDYFGNYTKALKTEMEKWKREKAFKKLKIRKRGGDNDYVEESSSDDDYELESIGSDMLDSDDDVADDPRKPKRERREQFDDTAPATAYNEELYLNVEPPASKDSLLNFDMSPEKVDNEPSDSLHGVGRRLGFSTPSPPCAIVVDVNFDPLEEDLSVASSLFNSAARQQWLHRDDDQSNGIPFLDEQRQPMLDDMLTEWPTSSLANLEDDQQRGKTSTDAGNGVRESYSYSSSRSAPVEDDEAEAAYVRKRAASEENDEWEADEPPADDVEEEESRSPPVKKMFSLDDDDDEEERRTPRAKKMFSLDDNDQEEQQETYGQKRLRLELSMMPEQQMEQHNVETSATTNLPPPDIQIQEDFKPEAWLQGEEKQEAHYQKGLHMDSAMVPEQKVEQHDVEMVECSNAPSSSVQSLQENFKPEAGLQGEEKQEAYDQEGLQLEFTMISEQQVEQHDVEMPACSNPPPPPVEKLQPDVIPEACVLHEEQQETFDQKILPRDSGLIPELNFKVEQHEVEVPECSNQPPPAVENLWPDVYPETCVQGEERQETRGPIELLLELESIPEQHGDCSNPPLPAVQSLQTNFDPDRDDQEKQHLASAMVPEQQNNDTLMPVAVQSLQSDDGPESFVQGEDQQVFPVQDASSEAIAYPVPEASQNIDELAERPPSEAQPVAEAVPSIDEAYACNPPEGDDEDEGEDEYMD